MFAATVNVTVPPPLPLAPDVIVNHAGLLVADGGPRAAGHRRDRDSRACAPGRADRLILRCDRVTQGAAACVTVKVCSAIVSVPVRCWTTAFAATVNVTVPPPLPLAPDVIVNHASLLTAVHAQPAIVVTVTVVPAPPDAPID